MSKQIRQIPLAKPVFDEEMEAAALNALRNERFVLGESVYKFEEEFARYVGTKYAVSTSSGTNALQIALLALGVRGEVVTSAFSFVASANAVLHAGATPVFADIDAGTFNVDPEKMRQRVTKNTGALLPVHLYGHPCAMDEIEDLAEERGLRVVEDACQAHGAEYVGRRVGAIGDAGCFSFYSSKNMIVCGDGGMIVTNDEDVAKLAGKLRDCGRKTRYEHDVIGYTSRLNTVNAAIGRVQLKRLDDWNRRRLKNASVYNKLLSGLADIQVPPTGDAEVKPVYHLYVIKAKRRDELSAWLQKVGVQCAVHYPLPIPMQPVYKQLFNFKSGDYLVSESVSKDCLSLPMHPFLSEEDIEYVCESVQKYYANPQRTY
jgi:perosamine synthetase